MLRFSRKSHKAACKKVRSDSSLHMRMLAPTSPVANSVSVARIISDFEHSPALFESLVAAAFTLMGPPETHEGGVWPSCVCVDYSMVACNVMPPLFDGLELVSAWSTDDSPENPWPYSWITFVHEVGLWPMKESFSRNLRARLGQEKLLQQQDPSREPHLFVPVVFKNGTRINEFVWTAKNDTPLARQRSVRVISLGFSGPPLMAPFTVDQEVS